MAFNAIAKFADREWIACCRHQRDARQWAPDENVGVNMSAGVGLTNSLTECSGENAADQRGLMASSPNSFTVIAETVITG